MQRCGIAYYSHSLITNFQAAGAIKVHPPHKAHAVVHIGREHADIHRACGTVVQLQSTCSRYGHIGVDVDVFSGVQYQAVGTPANGAVNVDVALVCACTRVVGNRNTAVAQIVLQGSSTNTATGLRTAARCNRKVSRVNQPHTRLALRGCRGH